MKIISREDAIKENQKYYFTGTPCTKGHVSKRIVSSWRCHQCHLDMTRRKRIEKGCIPWSKTEEEKKARRRATLKKYWETHKELIKQRASERHLIDPSRRKQIVKKWDQKNKEYRALNEQNRRARKLKNGGTLSNGLKSRLFELQKGKCACCGEPLGNDYHMDHIMPIARGGSNEDWNIQLLRRDCNISKNAKHPIDFMQSRGFLL